VKREFDAPTVVFDVLAHVIRVPQRHVARVELAASLKSTVLQELDFGAGRLAVVAEFTRDLSAVSLQRPKRLARMCP
jgi:hypothetical protein